MLEKSPTTCHNPDPREAPLVNAVPGGQREAGGDEGAGAAPEAGAPNKVQPGELRIRIYLKLFRFFWGEMSLLGAGTLRWSPRVSASISTSIRISSDFPPRKGGLNKFFLKKLLS